MLSRSASAWVCSTAEARTSVTSCRNCKAELGERFAGYASAKKDLFDYIEVFYNQQHRHSSPDSSARPSTKRIDG